MFLKWKEIPAETKAEMRAHFELKLPSRTLELGGKTLIMGILNVTPDSFFDGGSYARLDRAFRRGMQLEDEGADLVDVGGESTRPSRVQALPVAEEIKRVVPVIKRLAKRLSIPLSVDTYKSEVAYEAIDAGAMLVNDISGLRFDPDMARVSASSGAAMVLMHSRGNPEQLHGLPSLKYPLQSVVRGLGRSIQRALTAGLRREQLILDPGLGFGKKTEDNLTVLRRLEILRQFDLPILVGPSRKSFIGEILGQTVQERLLGSLSSVAVAIVQGAHIVRVHDVKETRQVVKMCDAIMEVSEQV